MVVVGSNSSVRESLENKLRQFTSYDVENFSVARLLLLPSIYDKINPNTSIEDFSHDEKTEIRKLLDKKQDVDYQNCTKNSLKEIIHSYNVDLGFCEKIDNLDNPDFSDYVHHFTNKYDYLTFLKDRLELTDGRNISDEIRSKVSDSLSDEKQNDFFRNEGLDMHLVDIHKIASDKGIDTNDLPEFVTFRMKSKESLMMKLVDRLARLYDISEKDISEMVTEVRDIESSDIIYSRNNPNRVGLEGIISEDSKLNEEDIRKFVFEGYLKSVLDEGIDFYQFREDSNLNDNAMKYTKGKLEYKLNGKLSELIHDLYLIDATGFKVITSNNDQVKSLQSRIEDLSEENPSIDLKILRSRTDKNGNYEKDGSFTVGLTNPSIESSYSEGKIQNIEGLYCSEFGFKGIRGHGEYKASSATKLKKKISEDETGDLKNYLLRISDILGVNGEEALRRYAKYDPKGFNNY